MYDMKTMIEKVRENVTDGGKEAINEEIYFNGQKAGLSCPVAGCKKKFKTVEEFGLHHFENHLGPQEIWRVMCSCPGPNYRFRTYVETFEHVKKWHYCFDKKVVLSGEYCKHDPCYKLGGNSAKEQPKAQHPQTAPV